MGITVKDVMERIECQRLFMQHYAKMYRVARTILYDEQESEDVVSDIFEHLLYGETILMPDTEERYLLTSVRNQCFKRLRHVSNSLQGGDYAELADDSETDDERLTDIDEFVANHLSVQEQRIFRLRFTDGYSYEEIATAEDISRVAVWKHLSHALNIIRQHFKE
jgi:RNA polymerase sigma-70 factor (ECF subfamily)